jgi:hypothetical protein
LLNLNKLQEFYGAEIMFKKLLVICAGLLLIGASHLAFAQSKIIVIHTSVANFDKIRCSGDKYWWYERLDARNPVTFKLKEIENTDKGIALEGYGLKFVIDPLALRMTYTVGTSQKAVNIDEIKTGVDLSSFTQLQYDGGQLSFQEDIKGPMDNWELKTKDGDTSTLIELAYGVFYDPVRNIEINVDLEKKKISFDSQSKKPIVKNIKSFN